MKLLDDATIWHRVDDWWYVRCEKLNWCLLSNPNHLWNRHCRHNILIGTILRPSGRYQELLYHFIPIYLNRKCPAHWWSQASFYWLSSHYARESRLPRFRLRDLPAFKLLPDFPNYRVWQVATSNDSSIYPHQTIAQFIRICHNKNPHNYCYQSYHMERQLGRFRVFFRMMRKASWNL